MSAGRRLLTFLALTLPVGLFAAAPLAARDRLDDVKARRAAEAQRLEDEVRKARLEVERLFRGTAEQRSAAIVSLEGLVITVQLTEALTPARRNQFVVTLRADIKRIQGQDFGDLLFPNICSKSGGVGEGCGKAPAGGREISRKRPPTPALTPRERSTLEALRTVISADYTNATFEAVIDHLQKTTGLNILVDRQAMMEAGVGYESTLNLKLKATTRTVLRRVLGDLGLAYTVKNGDIHVTTIARAREDTTIRAYSITALAAVINSCLPGLLPPTVLPDNDRMIALVTQTVEPQSWKVNNPQAPGAIIFEPALKLFAVRQTAEVHYALAGFR